MTYRICCEDGVPISSRDASAVRTETFRTEREALKRARELLDSDHCATERLHVKVDAVKRRTAHALGDRSSAMLHESGQ